MNNMENTSKAVELQINTDEVVARYKITEAIELVRTRTAIFFHTTCFWVVSKPTLANNGKGGALYEMLSTVCDYLDNPDVYDAEDKEYYDLIISVIGSIFTLPLDAFTDGEYCMNVAELVMTERNKYYKRLEEEAKKHVDSEEDALENARFEGTVAMAEELDREIKEVKKKRNSKK